MKSVDETERYAWGVETKSLFQLPKRISGIVYSIPCEDCDVEYIGETGRAFGTRQGEHERAVRLKKSGNSFSIELFFNDEDHSI